MATERMKFVSIVGPIQGFDEFIVKHIMNKDMQPVHALSFTESVKGLKPFVEDNSYESAFKALESINRFMKVQPYECCESEIMDMVKAPADVEKTISYAKELEARLAEIREKIERNKAEIAENRQILRQLLPIKDLEVELEQLFNLEYIKIRFGKLPKESFKKLDLIVESLDVIVIPFSSDENDVWICYLMPAAVAERIDNVMSSLFFERIRISGKVKGHPRDAIVKIEQDIKRLEEEIGRLESDFQKLVSENGEEFRKLYSRFFYLNQAANVKKYAAYVKETFLLTGWITENSYRELTEDLKGQKDIVITVEEPEEVKGIKPPTILKNNKFFKPFEALVKMYGIPAHNEIDPTLFVALTYILMFGAMFGDVGQGAILALAGIFMYRKKKSPLGWILGCVGVSSVVFGFLYGSVFGYEHLISPLWKPPMENISQLLVVAIGFGIVMVITAIMINIINSIKAKDYGRLLFDKNGVAGLVFYGGVLGIVLSALLKGNLSLSFPVIALIVIVPLLLMLFKEKLERLLFRHESGNREGGSLVESFFEVFEAVLGFLSNTVSFVRVGAFALSHAGLALAIWTLYGMVGRIGGIVVLIIGNILIIGLEGLIVAIQGLRLEYYELFSRFFSGTGREFKTIRVCERLKLYNKQIAG